MYRDSNNKNNPRANNKTNHKRNNNNKTKNNTTKRVTAPTNKSDHRFLASGAYKSVWLRVPNLYRDMRREPHDDKVIVNSLEYQRKEDGNIKYFEDMKHEFEFTRKMKTIFPKLIPHVEEVTDIDPTEHFRYSKERCRPITINNDIFLKMIMLSDMLIDKEWVYLDMKPENLGLLNGETMIIDTDPKSFYMIPESHRPFYKKCCHMIILLYCYNFLPAIDISVLKEFINQKEYSKESFDTLCEESRKYDGQSFVNEIINYNRYKLNYINSIQLPLLYIEGYGKKDPQNHIVRFQSLLDEVLPKPETPINNVVPKPETPRWKRQFRDIRNRITNRIRKGINIIKNKAIVYGARPH